MGERGAWGGQGEGGGVRAGGGGVVVEELRKNSFHVTKFWKIVLEIKFTLSFKEIFSRDFRGLQILLTTRAYSSSE